MMTFCLNHCLRDVTGLKDCTDLWTGLLRAHKELGKPTDYPILLPDEPGNIRIAGKSLKELIGQLPNEQKEAGLRRLAYAMLKNYPLTAFFTEELDIDEAECTTYQFLGQDAENLFWAHKMGWLIASVPVCDEVKKNELELNTGNGTSLVNNWYGNNLHFVKQLEEGNASNCEKRLTDLEFLFDGKKTILSDEFKKKFRKAPTGLQELIKTKLKDAYQANLLFPAKANDKLVKYCEGTGNENTYELRSGAMGGMRVYFFSDEKLLIIAALHTKAESVGKEQSADIRNASAQIRKLR